MSDDKHGPMDKSAADSAAGDSGPEIDFITFIMSLATSVLMQLGEHEEGEAAPPENLPLAKQTIEILGMLHEKTRGNLSSDEVRVIEGVLYDLRMRYLQKTRG
jgi:hypothetical protein